MIRICSLAPGLANRLSQIYDELKCPWLTETKREELIRERDIKRDLLSRMIEQAKPVRRKRKKRSDSE